MTKKAGRGSGKWPCVCQQRTEALARPLRPRLTPLFRSRGPFSTDTPPGPHPQPGTHNTAACLRPQATGLPCPEMDWNEQEGWAAFPQHWRAAPPSIAECRSSLLTVILVLPGAPNPSSHLEFLTQSSLVLPVLQFYVQ